MRPGDSGESYGFEPAMCAGAGGPRGCEVRPAYDPAGPSLVLALPFAAARRQYCRRVEHEPVH